MTMFKRKKIGPKSTIEDVINKHLEGELKEQALEFVPWLKANGVTKWRNNPMDWKLPYGEHYPCMIQFDPNQWRFTFFAGDYSGDFEEGFAKAVQDNVKPCTSCHGGCIFGRDITIFGKEFTNACSQLTVQFENPDAATLDHIKKLFEYWRTAEPSDSWHYHN